MGKYATVADVLAENVPASTDPARIDRRINKWENIVERLTRNIFYVYEPGPLVFPGSNSKYLHFSLALVDVISVTVNEDALPLDPTEYRAYTGKQKPQDHRSNPKIELRTPTSRSIYRRTHAIFAKGYDQIIEAKWGFVEPDLSTPQAIKDSIVKLVALDLQGYFDQVAAGTTGRPLTPVRREKTDGHEREYMETEDERIYFSAMPRDIYDTLMLYRAPWKIAVPDPREFAEIPEIIAY